jgi:hypothetical protein
LSFTPASSGSLAGIQLKKIPEKDGNVMEPVMREEAGTNGLTKGDPEKRTIAEMMIAETGTSPGI